MLPPMPETLSPDLCVIGAGAGGLVVAAGAAQLGARVVVVERGGGQAGGVACRALLAAADLGFAAAMTRVRAAVAETAVHAAPTRLAGLGIALVSATGRFDGPDLLSAGAVRVKARKFVLATGAKPTLPAIPGLAEAGFLTYDSVFALAARPDHLAVLGGGPIGVVLAQAFRRLGSRVTIVERAALLPREDAELAAVVRLALRRDGIVVHEGAAVNRVAPGPRLHLDGGGVVEASHLLVAAGRRPAVDGLGLEAAHVAFDGDGIRVDDRLRTTNRRIYAVGDVTGGPQSTAVATYHAGLVLRHALFRLPVRQDLSAAPSVVLADPELARVGLDEEAARAAHGRIEVLRWPFADLERARADDARDGLIKVILDRRGRILGAAIVGRHAGELIQPWALAVDRKLGIGAMAGMIAATPTWGEISRRVAVSHFLPRLLSDRAKSLARLLARLPGV